MGAGGFLVDIPTRDLLQYRGIFILQNSNRTRKENEQDCIMNSNMNRGSNKSRYKWITNMSGKGKSNGVESESGNKHEQK